MPKKAIQSPTSEQTFGIVIFSDIRGFSEWSSKIDAHESTMNLVYGFQKLLRDKFPDFFFKGLGDGAMLVKVADLYSLPDINNALATIVSAAKDVESIFSSMVSTIRLRTGSAVHLDLGWGITRGNIIKVSERGASSDFLGHVVNEAARLCDLARPRGMVIDSDDFPEAPNSYVNEFFPQIRRLSKPGQDVNTWVSKEIFEQFLSRESLKEVPEVHVAGVCMRWWEDEILILIAKRNGDRKLFPGKWESCGGQLRNSESFFEGVERHFSMEMKITVQVVEKVSPTIYEIVSSSLIPGLRFACYYVEGEPSSPNHSEIKWVSVEELRSTPESDFPPNFKSQAISLASACVKLLTRPALSDDGS